MEYKVNEKCIGCGLCVSICPDVFSMNNEGIAEASEDEVLEADLESAALAKDSCPVDAIEEV